MDFTRARVVTRWVGLAVGLGSAAYFARELGARWPEIEALPWNGAILVALAWALAVQFSSALLDAWSWAWLLRAMRVDVHSRDVIAIFGVAQFAKYLPGNVAQHVGRVVEARTKGWQTGRVVLSLLVESGFGVGAGALVAGAGLLLVAGGEPRVAAAVIGLLLGSVAGVAILGGLLAHPPARLRQWLAMEEAIELRVSFLLGYLAIHVLSYVAVGGSLVLILHALVEGWPPALWRVPAAVALSWLAGYLVPGAPAGLGVREATLTALLGSSLGTDVVVPAALLWRCAALLTDVTMLLVGLRLRRVVSGD